MENTKTQAPAEYARAMDKIRDEMAKKHDKPAVVSVGEVMTELLTAYPEWAAKILAKDKTLEGAYKALEDYARANRKSQSCVYLGPDRAAKVLAGYYGVTVPEPGEAARASYRADLRAEAADVSIHGDKGPEIEEKAPAVTLAAPDEIDAFSLDALMGV